MITIGSLICRLGPGPGLCWIFQPGMCLSLGLFAKYGWAGARVTKEAGIEVGDALETAIHGHIDDLTVAASEKGGSIIHP